MGPATPDQRPAVLDAYLADLDRALTGVDADAQDEIARSVEEHIDAALRQGSAPSAIVAELGPVEQIIEAAGIESELAGTTATQHASRGPVLALVGAAVAVITLVLAPPLAIAPAAVVLAGSFIAHRRAPDGRYVAAAVVGGMVLAMWLVLVLALTQTSSPEPTSPEPAQQELG